MARLTRSGNYTRRTHRFSTATVAVCVSLGIVLAVAAQAVASSASARVERAPVKQLPPGLVILARPQTPQGVITIGVHRIRFLGKVRLCITEGDHPGDPRSGVGNCASYPLGPSSGQGIDHTNLFLGPVYSGRCRHKDFRLITAVVLRPGLTASLQARGRSETRMASVPIPNAFNVPGPLAYAVARGWQPTALVLRDAEGKIVSRIPITPGGSCSTT